MDVKITITCDENALEFSRNLQGFYMNLVSGEVPKRIGKTAWVSENEEKLKLMENEKGERPWEQSDTVEPDEIKTEASEPVPTVDQKPTPVEGTIEKQKHTLVEIRERGNAFAMAKGMNALKTILNKYGIPKLTAPEAEQYFDQLWDDLEV